MQVQSMHDNGRDQAGLTTDSHASLKQHNEGGVPHTSKFRPWYIKTAIAFRDREKATAFETYLKSGSGRKFACRHF